jgi:hypothetical protein
MTKWTIVYRNAAGDVLAAIEGLKIHLLPKTAAEPAALVGA